MKRFFHTVRLTLFVVFVGLGMAAGATAWAQGCSDTATVHNNLATKYGEVRIGTGWLADETAIIEVWSNRESGSWTILRTTAGGISCVMSSGQGYIEWPEPPNL